MKHAPGHSRYFCIPLMTVTTTHLKKLASGAAAALARTLGVAAPVLSQARVEVSRLVTAEVVEASVGGDFEEHARLLFLPVEGSLQDAEADSPWRAGIQLHYLRQSAEEGRATLVSLYFHPDYLAQWPPAVLAATPAFRRDALTEHQLTLSSQMESLLDELCGGESATTDFSTLLRRTEAAAALLRRALDAIAAPFTACPVPACRFLAIETERDKIFLARDILEARTDDRPLTIKDLSRRVAMNECYLKKGFKALTGKTVYDFQHERRIARAQQLLQQEGRSVSEVAETLHFSSISHFSTAFKKATGLKPCELLR